MSLETHTEHILVDALGRLRPSLTRRARAIVRNHADVEDVVQETAVRAWDARSRLRTGSDPAPWLNTIVTRVAIDFARKAQRQSMPENVEFSVPQPSAEERFVHAETIDAVRAAAASLQRDQQRVLFMHDYIGMSSHEIAHLEQVPYNTVRTRLRRARRTLRDRLEGAV